MKYLFSSFLIIYSFSSLFAQNTYLLPRSFFPQKGEMVEIGGFYGKGFDTIKAKRVPVSQFSGATLYASGKPVDLLPAGTKNTQNYLSVQLNNPGICLVAAKKELLVPDLDREDVIRQLADEGFNSLASKAGDKEEMSVNNIFSSKTLLMVNKPSGGYYEEKTGHDLEIVLMQNPYKMKYGEDLTVQILFRGKPLAQSKAEVYTRTLNGTIFVGDNVTDADGKLYIKLNRSGDWMIKAINAEAASQGADYNHWCSTYTFGFRSE